MFCWLLLFFLFPFVNWFLIGHCWLLGYSDTLACIVLQCAKNIQWPNIAFTWRIVDKSNVKIDNSVTTTFTIDFASWREMCRRQPVNRTAEGIETPKTSTFIKNGVTVQKWFKMSCRPKTDSKTIEFFLLQSHANICWNKNSRDGKTNLLSNI